MSSAALVPAPAAPSPAQPARAPRPTPRDAGVPLYLQRAALTVGAPDSPLEEEAEEVSAQPASVPRVLRQTVRPGGTPTSTREGGTTYARGFDAGGLGAEVRAHEAVHRAQFGVTGRRFGNRGELEADAHAGAAQILKGHAYAPRYAAPRGMTLNYEAPAWMPDTVEVTQREQASATRLHPGPGEKPRIAINQVEIEEGTLRSQSFELTSEAAGVRGRIYSGTRIGIVQDSGNPMVSVVSVSRDPLQELGPSLDVPAYPMRIVYSRSIQFRDDKGRTCTVEMAGNVHFTEERWRQQLAGRTASFDTLLDMVGNVGFVSVRLDGQSPIDGFTYRMRLDVSAQSVREQLAMASGLPNLMAGLGTTLTSSKRADFLLIDAPAGVQFDALQAFLYSADQHEIERRMAQLLAQLAALMRDEEKSDSWLDSLASWLGDKVSRAWNALPAPVRGALKAIGKAGLAIAAVIGTAALVVALAPVELSVATVALVIGGALLAASFVASLFRRRAESTATGKGGALGIIGAALGDATGVSDVYQAITDESILSGTPLNRSEEERWESGVLGGIQVVATVFGAKAAFQRAQPFARTTVTRDPTLPAGEGFTDPLGNITVSTKGSAADQALVVRHEKVHSFFSPRFKPLRMFRAKIGQAAYERSALLRYIEEALAETHAQMKVNGLRGLPEGVRFPIANGYVTLSQVVTEAAVGTVVYGGIVYGVYVLTDDDESDSPRPAVNPRPGSQPAGPQP